MTSRQNGSSVSRRGKMSELYELQAASSRQFFVLAQRGDIESRDLESIFFNIQSTKLSCVHAYQFFFSQASISAHQPYYESVDLSVPVGPTRFCRCLEIVHRVVPQLYRINHETLLKELNESLEALSTKSKSVGDFANLTLQYRQAEHLTR